MGEACIRESRRQAHCACEEAEYLQKSMNYFVLVTQFSWGGAGAMEVTEFLLRSLHNFLNILSYYINETLETSVHEA